MPADPPVLDEKTRALMKQWVDIWKRVGPILADERDAELARLTESEAARVARDLVWPMGTLNGYRGSDDGAGLETIKRLLRAHTAR